MWRAHAAGQPDAAVACRYVVFARRNSASDLRRLQARRLPKLAEFVALVASASLGHPAEEAPLIDITDNEGVAAQCDRNPDLAILREEEPLAARRTADRVENYAADPRRASSTTSAEQQLGQRCASPTAQSRMSSPVPAVRRSRRPTPLPVPLSASCSRWLSPRTRYARI